MLLSKNVFALRRAAVVCRPPPSLPRHFAHDAAGDDSRVVVKEIEDGIVHVELNRADKMNALDMKMFNAIADAAKKVAADTSIRCVILSGKGKAFCTGLDVKSVFANPLNSVKLLEKPGGTPASNLAQDVGYLWRRVKCPVVASVHGMCFGGGLQIALGADIRYATADCKLSIMEAKWGLIPDMSASVTLRELLRVDVAKELTMTGRVIDGTEAARIGLVTSVKEDPFASALEFAREIVARSPDAVAHSKTLLNSTHSTGCSEADALDVETRLQKELLGSYNQMAASSRSLGVAEMPYKNRKE